MTISVVIPAYNAAGTIRDAIASVRAQTCPADEIIVVDDGSTDDSAGIVQREFPECRLVRQQNAGPAAARNRGAETATGEWIAFLDSDDAWLPDRLSVQLASSAAMPEVGMWCGGTLPLTPGAVSGRRVGNGGTEEAEIPSGEALDLSRFAVLNPVATSSVLLRKEAFLCAGGFDEKLRGPEDYDLWIRVAAVCPVRLLTRPLVLYRRTEGSLSLDDKAFLPEVLRVIEKAYGPGGCLRMCGHRRKAISYQHLAASWSAMSRGDRLAAMALYLRGLVLWPFSYRPEWDAPLARLKLLFRILRLKSF